MTDEKIEFTPDVIEKKHKHSIGSVILVAVAILLIIIASASLYAFTLNNSAYTGSKTISIEEGETVPEITEKFEKEGIVKSAEFMYLLLTTLYDSTQIKASEYVFEAPFSTIKVIERIIAGDFDTNLSQVIVFEGESREKIADRLNAEIKWFDPEYFLSTTTDLEGKLFPDTYFVPETFSTNELVKLMHDTYLETIAEYEIPISDSPLNETEVVTLASIVEREANTTESMRTVAGILLNRLNIDMALQADASIEYVLEHELNELAPGELAENLREFDSPYNTYLYPGLPPTPIGNPGRIAIEAVLFPIESEYLYYLTDSDGVFHYAETYNQHLRNISTYLR